MNRYLTVVALVVGLAATPATAQDLQGRWLNVGNTAQGGTYAFTVIFDGRGSLQSETALSGSPGQAAGTTQCQGNYQISGGNLATRWSSCRTCISGGCMNTTAYAQPFGGPVQVLNQDNVTISGDRFSRQ
jgi:hypothetical protein